MSYTTVTKVRQSAGFVGNNNVTDAFIALQITNAEAEVDSGVSGIYALPFPTYYKQTIVFSGTGTGTDTMTITIDGTDYDIAITSGLTAAAAADLFRTAALNSNSFVLDGLGAGATVTIYSRVDDDPTDVTITSTDPQTVEGITATGGTVTAVVPPTVESLTTEFAAGCLLVTEYGSESQDTNKDGFKRRTMVRAMLKKIQEKQLKILDFAKNEIPVSSTKRISFFPVNADSKDANGEDVVTQFTMNEKF